MKPGKKDWSLMIGASIAVLAVVWGLVPLEPAHAASPNVGDAVYRDGVVWGLEWHAAIMDDPHYNTTTLPVIQQGGSGYVKWESWAGFLGGKTYQGYYRPKGTITEAMRDNFRFMARKLKDDQIQYNVIYQVYYAPKTGAVWVMPADVESMRCDGVVEYVYEWYGFRVFGETNSTWDVTRSDWLTREQHTFPNIGPKKQASLLTRVGSGLP